MNRYSNATIAELADETMHVQSACNLRAVAASYVDVLDALRRHGFHGDALAAHPITRAWADKIAALAGVQSMDSVELFAVGDAVNKLANI